MVPRRTYQNRWVSKTLHIIPSNTHTHKAAFTTWSIVLGTIIGDNLFVENRTDLARAEVREAMKTWLAAEDQLLSIQLPSIVLEEGLMMAPRKVTKIATAGQRRAPHLRRQTLKSALAYMIFQPPLSS